MTLPVIFVGCNGQIKTVGYHWVLTPAVYTAMASDSGHSLSSNMVHPAAAVTKLAGTLHKVTDATGH